MTDEQRNDARALLGTRAEAFDDDQLFGALLLYGQGAATIHENLSRTNADLQLEFDQFREQHPDVIELSASQRETETENVLLRVGRLKDKFRLPEAYAQELEKAFTGDDVILLSASATPGNPAMPKRLLALLDKWPAGRGLDTGRGVLTGPQGDEQLLTLSRATTTDPTGTVATGAAAPNPYDDAINRWAARPLDRTA